jgi:hypothetical protein
MKKRHKSLPLKGNLEYCFVTCTGIVAEKGIIYVVTMADLRVARHLSVKYHTQKGF